jgi:recombination associated protein RdgC
MWFKNLQAYKIKVTAIELQKLADQLALPTNQFAPCPANDVSSQGFASPRGTDQMTHTVNQQILLLARFEKKNLPSKIVEKALNERCAELEQQQGFAPGRKARKDIKERVFDELLPRAFAMPSQINIWLDPIKGYLYIDTPTPSKADDIIKMLLKLDCNLGLDGLRVKMSPSAAMGVWIGDEEAPKGFTIDQDAKFVSHAEDKATVKFSNHSLDHSATRDAVMGKNCVELAMTWNDKISFVLTENLSIKRIKALDILNEDSGNRGENADERFDSDFVLMAAELAAMMDDLIFALGGQVEDIPE